MYTWPTTQLPEAGLVFDGEPVQDGVLRTPFETGRVRQRMRFTSELNAFNVQWTMNPYQFWFFRSWHRYYISKGADYFLANIATGDMVDGYAPFGVVQVAVRFQNGKYKYKLQNDWFIVNATLETEDPLEMSHAALQAILGYS